MADNDDRFPHLDSGDFPNISNIDVFKFDNQIDYSRFNYSQMHITVCTVPWDMGEAHIGARTISGIGNVVAFEDTAARDAWFAALTDQTQSENFECFRFSTKLKNLHRDNTIDLPLPFDIAARFNYVVVEYELFANANSTLQYETAGGVRKWFWFIREVEFLAPNTTRVHLMNDAWQTFIYDVNIGGMILERGHAPMLETDAATYLANPIANSMHLLTPDVDFGTAEIARSSNEFVFNAGIMHAVFFCTGNPSSLVWGTKADGTWKTPCNYNFKVNGTPAYTVFSIAALDLDAFIDSIHANTPQFFQTVKAIAFVSASLLTLGTSWTWNGTTCYFVSANYKQNTLQTLNKSAFGYDSKYADIAKLYTSPYAHIELTDESGNVTIVKVENTNGTLQIESALNLVFPFVNINAHITGIGKTTRRNATFYNITSHNMPIQGNWYETLRTWQIPTVGINLDTETENDYATHFDRAQQKIAYEAEQDNAEASATTAQSNANASATTAQSNANASADTTSDNAELQTAANSAINTTSNTASYDDTSNVISTNVACQAWDAGYTRATTNNEIQADIQSAAVGVAGNVFSSVASGAMSGGLAGAGAGLVMGAISGVASGAQTAISTNLKETQAETTIAYSEDRMGATNGSNRDRNTIQINANTDNTDTNNDYIEGVAANNAALTVANAERDYDTATANATRDYNTAIGIATRNAATAQSAIDNQIKQAALNSPAEFGSWSAGDYATTRPQGLWANVVTESDSAISQAGDEFLRYGYMYDRQWQFDGDWNLCDHFTYWKLKDFWVSGLNVPDMYMDKLRFFLYGGVTVWSDPDDIGNVSIYENGL